ncbi:CPBP family intramembrane metalloprotease [Lewinellaceae bacterium SD302]|nr:CPBP family intramembrane metalloprotease [Lewinellaceae bacterium SD302]
MQSAIQKQPTNYVIYSILILAFYLFGQFAGRQLYPYYGFLLTDLDPALRSFIWSATYNGIVPLVGTILIFGRKGLGERLGLNHGFWKGLVIAFIMTLPMLIGYAWIADFTVNIDLRNDFLFGTLTAPFFEEFFFRAFLFGLLYRYAGWGLWPATLLDGLLFGAIHISQGHDVVSAVSVFAVTGLGAVGFSIIYKEWEWNLWLVIFLHAFMNFHWMAFDMAENAAGGLWANVFRVMTILVAIGWTVLETRKRKEDTNNSKQKESNLILAN